MRNAHHEVDRALLTRNARAPANTILYFCALILILTPRPQLYVGFALTPTYILLILVVILVMRPIIPIYAHERLLISFYMLAVVTTIYSYDPALSARFAVGVVFFVTLLLINKALLSGMEVRRALRTLASVGKVYCLLSFFLYLLGIANFNYLNEHELYGGVFIERGFPRMTGLSFDPNFFAMTLIPFVFMFLTRRHYFWLTFACFLLLLSFSRGGWLAFTVGCIALVSVSRPKKVATFILFILVFLSATYLAYTLNIFGFSEIVDSRFVNLSHGSGRLELWKNAWLLFLERPIFGWGIFTFRKLSADLFMTNQFSHNTYLDVLVETGVVGAVIFFLFMCFLSARAYHVSRKSIELQFLFPTVVSCAVALNFLSLYINTVFLFYISICTFSINERLPHNGR